MKLYSSEEIPIPRYAEVLLFRAKSDGLLYYKKNSGETIKLRFSDGVYAITDKTIVRVINYTDQIVDSILVEEGIVLWVSNVPNIVVGGGGGSRGSQGAQGAQGVSALGYKVYDAIVNQSGSSAPVAIVHTNTLSGTPVWSRTSSGLYMLTLAGEFPVHTNVFVLSTGQPGVYTIVNPGNLYITPFVHWDVLNVDSIFFETFYNGQAPADNLFQDFCVELRVYP